MEDFKKRLNKFIQECEAKDKKFTAIYENLVGEDEVFKFLLKTLNEKTQDVMTKKTSSEDYLNLDNINELFCQRKDYLVGKAERIMMEE